MVNIDHIAAQIIDDYDLNERVRLANMPASELEKIEVVLAKYIADKLKEDGFYGNAEEHTSDEVADAMEILGGILVRTGQPEEDLKYHKESIMLDPLYKSTGGIGFAPHLIAECLLNDNMIPIELSFKR